MTSEHRRTAQAEAGSPGVHVIRWSVLSFLVSVYVLVIVILLRSLAFPYGFIAGVGALMIAFALIVWIYEMPAARIERLLLGVHRRADALRTVGGVFTMEFMVIAAMFFSIGGLAGYEYGVTFALVGGLLLGMVLLAHEARVDGRRVVLAGDARAARSRTRWPELAAGVILLAAVVEMNGPLLGVGWLSGVDARWQFVLIIAAVLLVARGLAGQRIEAGDGRRRVDRREALAVTAIMLVAVAVRVYEMGTAARFFIDELHFSNASGHFNAVSSIKLLMPFSSVAAFPYLYPFMQWGTIQIFGSSIEALRAVSAFFGVWNVLALYLLARELFDRKTALLAAGLLATFPPHIQFSRIGLNNIAEPVFGTLAFYFIARGLNRVRAGDIRWNFALAGVMLGLTQYFYEGGRLLYPPLALGWLALLGAAGYATYTGRLLRAKLRGDDDAHGRLLARANRWRGHEVGKGLAVLFIGAILVGGPIYTTLIANDRPVIQRMETAGLDAPTISVIGTDPIRTLVHLNLRMRDTLLLHTSVRESGLYYAGEQGLILGFVLPFFFLGVFYALWRLDQRGALLLILWLAATWLGNAFLQDSRIAPRYVVVLPALMLATALGLRCAARLLWPSNARTRNLVAAGVLSALMVLQVAYYFGPHLRTFNHQFRRNLVHDSHDAIFRAATFPPDTHVNLIGEYNTSQRDAEDMLRFLNGSLTISTMTAAQFTDGYLQGMTVDRDYAFFIEADDVVRANMLRGYFPHIEGPYFSDNGVPVNRQLVLYYLPRRAVADNDME